MARALIVLSGEARVIEILRIDEAHKKRAY